MPVPENDTAAPLRRLTILGTVSWLEAALTVAVVPMLVLSQWLTVRWQLPARSLFNITLVVGALIILLGRWQRLRRYRFEVVVAVLLGLLIVLSTVVNEVPIRTAGCGVLPYLGVLLVLLAALAARVDRSTVRTAGRVAVLTGGVLAVAALLQLALGRAGHVLTGQDLSYPRWWERGRATGLVASPGRLGQLGILSIALAPALAAAAPWAVVAAVVGGFSVAASGTRIVLLTLAVLIAVWALMRTNRTSRFLAMGAAVGLVAFAAIILAVPAARDDLFNRSAAVFDDSSGLPADVRVANFAATRRVVAAYPILGPGPGRFGSSTAWREKSELHDEFGLPDVRSEEFLAELRARGDQREIDVGIAQLELGWAQIAAELGLIALAGYLLLMASVAVRGFRADRPAVVALLAALAVISIASPGIVDFSLAATVLWWAGALLTVPRPHGEATIP